MPIWNDWKRSSTSRTKGKLEASTKFLLSLAVFMGAVAHPASSPIATVEKARLRRLVIVVALDIQRNQVQRIGRQVDRQPVRSAKLEG